MKYYKIIIHPSIWHLRPYKIRQTIQDKKYIEYGFLCFRFVIG